MRDRLLETVRQDAREQLDAAGATLAFRRRHRDWHLALAEEAAPQVIGPDLRDWLDRLEGVMNHEARRR